MTAGSTTGTQITLYALTYVDDHDAVMVGRPDTGSYGVFPREGADLLRSLGTGSTLESSVAQYERDTGETLDLADFISTLEDLGFLVGDDDAHESKPVRWRRTAAAVFSPPAMFLYTIIIAAGIVLMVADPRVRPGYRDIFFTSHIALIPIVMAVAQFPLLLIHEGFHALAARRLGLPSTLGIGRRFYYLVAETRLDALYSVRRSQRYLPFLAGSMVDAVGVAIFVTISAAGHHWGAPPWISGLALALGFSGVLRILWECLFYLETDFYFVISTATGCYDLHGAATAMLRGWAKRLVGRRAPDARPDWSERDWAAARWYAPLMVVGYGLSLAILFRVGLPTAVRFWSTVVDRIDGAQPLSAGVVIDTVFFMAMSCLEVGLLAYVTLRDLRSRRARKLQPSEGI